jgi:methyl-accepting chemotaxis protein
MKPGKNRRSWKNLLINKKVQLRVTMINLIFLFVAIGINTAIMLNSSLCNIFYTDTNGVMQFVDMYVLSSEILLFSLVAVLILAVVSQMVVTHQVCGPLVNFTHSFRKAADGDLTRPVHLRSRDLLQDEARAFNQMISNLSTYIEAVKTDNRILMKAIKSLDTQSPDPKKIQEIRQMLKEREPMIDEHLTKLRLLSESNPN